MIDHIIKEQIGLINKLRNNDKPVIVFVGGIPGSGKTRLVEKVKQDFSKLDFSIIEADLYRKYFNQKTDVESTVKFANEIEMELLNYSILNKKNIISISSLRSYHFLDKFIKKQIIPNNYEIYFYILLTNEIECILSCYERYIEDKKDNEKFERLNRETFFTSAYLGFLEANEFFDSKEYINCIKYFVRSEKLPILVNNSFIPVHKFVHSTLDIQKEQIEIDELNIRIEQILNNLDYSEKYEFNLLLEKYIQPFRIKKLTLRKDN